jgi:hypothetical protein
MKIIDKLSTYAALIGVVSAIGGGFYAWGEFNTRLSAIEDEPSVNLQPLRDKDKDLEKQFDEVLLYANEYKVDLIDRIKKVDDKIVKTDLTSVFKEIAKVREEMASLDIPDDVDLKPISKELKRLSEELIRIVATIPKVVDLKPLLNAITELEKSVAIALKENELQNILIEEIKTKANNPLAN